MCRLIDIGEIFVVSNRSSAKNRFGRLIYSVQHQHEIYTEVAVSADLSDKDVQAAQVLLNSLKVHKLCFLLHCMFLTDSMLGSCAAMDNSADITTK